MIINIETEAAAEKSATRCAWAVCYEIDHTAPGCQQDDGKNKIITVATFSDPYQAQNFITKCLPDETRERFFIIRIRNNYPEQIKQKYFT